jgi:hypothetical protein
MQLSAINVYVVSFMVLILLCFVYVHKLIDNSNKLQLQQEVCHKEVKSQLPSVDDSQTLAIENIVENYIKKRSMNKSNISKIWNGMMYGAIFGLASSAIVSPKMPDILASSIVSGIIGGINISYRLLYVKKGWLSDSKPT